MSDEDKTANLIIEQSPYYWVKEITDLANKYLELKERNMKLDKALGVAVDALKHYDHQKIKATKTPCGTGELHPLATDAITAIANILSGGKDEK